jgi:hypothetical protein
MISDMFNNAFRRRNYREPDDRSFAHSRFVRDRSQHRFHLQRQRQLRRNADRTSLLLQAGTGRQLRADRHIVMVLSSSLAAGVRRVSLRNHPGSRLDPSALRRTRGRQRRPLLGIRLWIWPRRSRRGWYHPDCSHCPLAHGPPIVSLAGIARAAFVHCGASRGSVPPSPRLSSPLQAS